MDVTWFQRGIAFEEFEAEERIRSSREAQAKSRKRGVRTMSGDVVGG